ncbi:hypothetical protein MAPG_02671 [Magnaporthiopsis poae ATCC 64411]|uniref:Uncharacterized protein n=1 Tax=Magnaporthiopsis poae (strain ATCC 64411 / 73-15) TaxID=644358 RepID=A0A0C4DS02_MAGP6|nr:hypothetical protein MAPG_02671 [Magnaporthiopsis poae ATCC 64411]
MHIPQLMPRLDRDCPVGSSWYVCQSNGFKGCCEVDPCDLASCPSSPRTPTDDAATTKNARATKTAMITVTSPITVTVLSSSSEAVRTSSSSMLTGDTTSSTASPAQPTTPRPPETRTGAGAVETPASIAGSGETPGVIRSDDRPTQLPAGAIAGIVLAGALVVLVLSLHTTVPITQSAYLTKNIISHRAYLPIGMSRPYQPTITTIATTQPGGGHARWESPDDIRWFSDANSDLVSPISPETGSCGPSRQGSRYARETAPPPPLLLPPGYPHEQQLQPQQQQPQQADSIPKFELDGREISPPPPSPQSQQRRDSSAGSVHPAPLRLGSGSGRTQPLRRPPRLMRRASDAGHYQSGIPYQQRVVVAAPRSHSRSLSGDGGGYYAVLGQHQEQQQPPAPPPVYRRRSSSQDRDYGNCRDSYNSGDARLRATLRATRHEVETGVHAGSWSVLSPA